MDLDTGSNTIKVKVTAEDGSTTKTYTVTVTRAAAASTDATLSGLTLSAGTLDPAFASATTAYAASVGNAEDEVTVTPEVAHAGATVEYLGASDTALADADTGKDGHQVALEVGETVVKVKVTAEDGTATQTYTLTLTRVSADATLSGLELSAGTLAPPFDAATTAYTASVIFSEEEITVTPEAGDPGATVEYLGASDTALADADTDKDGHQVDLDTGSNTIKVKVTAEDGSTTKTYTVTVTRAAAASTDATLSGLTLSAGTLDPAFASATTAYAASVGNAEDEVTVTPEVAHAGATVEYLGASDTALADADTGKDGHQVALEVGETVVKVKVTAEDGTATQTYTLTLTRVSADATLSGLELSAGTLAPPFDAATTSYTASVIFSEEEITVTPEAGDPGATVEYLGASDTALADADTDKDGHQVDLDTGSNTIKVKVTAEDGSTTKTYTVTVTRAAAASTDATLSGLTLSAGTLDPAFASATTAYAASVGNAEDEVTVTPEVAHAGATVEYLGASDTALADADTGKDGHQVALEVGETVVKVKVTAEDGTATQTYTLTLTRVSADATLSGLSLSAGTLSPVFDAATTSYTASVIFSEEEITVTPEAGDPGATVEYLGASDTALADADTDKDGHQVDLETGANTIKVKVTAEDGSTTKTYTVTVTRAAAASTDATLSGLTLSAGTLDPVFASATTAYAASVGNAEDEVTVTPEVAHAGATVEYLGASDTALADADTGKDGHQVALEVGETVVKVKVTAEDGTATQTYTLTLTRVSADATLSGLSLSAGTLSPVFDAATTAYTASVIFSEEEITVTPEAGDPGATVEYLGASDTALADADTDKDGHQVDLDTGSNTIKVKVTAEDGSTTKTYTVTVTRAAAASTDATLSGLTLSAGTLDPAFASATTAYAASVGNAEDEVTVTPEVAHAGATVEYLGASDTALADADTGKDGHQVALEVGETVVKVKVTAEDGTATQTYTLTLTRVSADATLSGLELSAGTLAPPFDAATTSYTASVIFSEEEITVTPEAGDPGATVEYLGASDTALADADTDKDGHQVDLETGSNTIKVKVTAEDGSTTKTYTVTVTRAAAASTDATLSGLTLSAGTLDPAFASATTAYAASVGNAEDEVTVTPEVAHAGATVEYLGASDTALADADTGKDGHQVALEVGETVVKVKVTAEDGTATQTYTLTLTRVSADATLSGLELSAGTLAPPFDAATTAYTASVIFSEEEITVTPEAGDPGATVEYLGASDTALADADTDKDGHQVDLDTGSNTIKVKVTAEDGSTTKTYTVTVTRAAAASTDATLSGLTLSAGTLDPAFASATTAYAASVGNAEDEVTVTPEVAHAGATVEYLGASDTALADADTGKDGHQVALEVGETVVKVKVTAEGTATQTYTLTLTRVSADAT